MPRPKTGENPLARYVDDARSRSMRLLLADALRRGLRPSDIAKLTGLDRKAFYDSLEVERPQTERFIRLAKDLGHSALVARALVCELTDREVRETQAEILESVAGERWIARNDAETTIVNAFEHLQRDERRAALAEYVLGAHGLLDVRASVLRAALAALDAYLEPRGFGFERYAASLADEERISAEIGFALLRSALPPSSASLAEILAPWRLGEVPGDLLAAVNEAIRARRLIAAPKKGTP